jgi:hypothetical protein
MSVYDGSDRMATFSDTIGTRMARIMETESIALIVVDVRIIDH